MSVARRPNDPELLKRFGARLRTVRDAGGVSQSRLADLVRMKPKTISLFETGDLSPTLTTVAALARALHVRVDDLLRDDGEIAVASPTDAEEAGLLGDFRAISEQERSAVRTMLRGLASRRG